MGRRHDAAPPPWAALGRGGRRPDDFVLRWFAAVACTLAVAGGVQYGVGAQLLAERLLEESLQQQAVHVPHLEEVLAQDLPPAAMAAAVETELEGVIHARPGMMYAGLFTAEGTRVAAAAPGGADSLAEAAIDPDLLQEVLRTGAPLVQEERETGETAEAGETARYEYLLPVRSADGTLVLEIDQETSVIEDLARDLRRNLALGVVAALLVAMPLSYAVGGRRLHLAQRRAKRQADVDPLTGLQGRRPFRPDVTAALGSTRRGWTTLALLDVDEFKQVNDRLGHVYGDHVLVALADALGSLPAGQTAYRLGGDEFAVLLRDADERSAVAAASCVRELLSEALPGITFSCGVASVAPDEAMTTQALWERADAALYEAKRTGRRRTVTFSDTDAPLTISPERVAAVRTLLTDRCRLLVAFQPIWDLHRGEVLGHEALLRLPDGVALSGPQEAFDLAQRLGCAAELDRRAREAVVGALPVGGWHGLLFVNVHPDALRGMDLAGFAHALATAGVQPADVVLEVTEQADLEHRDQIRTLKAARALGFRLALDDMGHSNAGLRALTLVHFDIVKIDRHVIASLGSDAAADATVAAATTFVHRSRGLGRRRGHRGPRRPRRRDRRQRPQRCRRGAARRAGLPAGSPRTVAPARRRDLPRPAPHAGGRPGRALIATRAPGGSAQRRGPARTTKAPDCGSPQVRGLLSVRPEGLEPPTF